MYETKSVQELETMFSVNKDRGLSKEEANRRLLEEGKNVLKTKKKKNIFTLFLSQFHDPMIYILLIAAVLSFLLDEFADGIIIMIVILLNAIVGTIQEAKAERALEALKKMSTPICFVKRDGVFVEQKAEDLVPGDIVLLEEGRKVPADVRFIQSMNIKTEEASLTGESQPVEKKVEPLKQKVGLGDRENMGFMSTSIVYGHGEGMVVATGMNTEIGHIAKMLHEAKEELTPLQKRLADLGKVLGILTVTLCVVLFGISLLQERNPWEMLITSISLAVAAIPEGLPAAVTIVLALGVQKMVKVNTIVRRLPSVETLGAVSVVCSDKTGTLTQNKMSIKEMFFEGKTCKIEDIKKEACPLLLEAMVLCNNASIEPNPLGDPTEIALLEGASLFQINKKELEHQKERINEIPFDSNRKMMSTMHRWKGQNRSYTKGALESILLCSSSIYDQGKVRPIEQKDIDKIRIESSQMAKKALRVLAFAYQDNVSSLREENLIFLGFVGMIDPPRKEAKEAVQRFKEAGIKTVMITGDHIDTAFAIAKELDIAQDESQCMLGKDLDTISKEEMQEKLAHTCVFARVTPEHKVKIVQAFKSQNQIVAMTGDGVNDAPSLKSADIGIAMGITGTDVAKEAADMVLVDDNFASIEKAVEEGRGIYANIKKAVLFLLSSNFGEVFTMFIGILLRMPIPLIAIHILWVNLITDTLPALALGVDPKDKDIMKEKPRLANESLFAGDGLKLTLFYGVFITLLTLFAYFVYPMSILIGKEGFSFLHVQENFQGIMTLFEQGDVSLGLSGEQILMKARSYAFTALGMSQLFHMLGMSNTKRSCIHLFKNRNWLMLFAFVFGLLLQVLVTEVPLLSQFFQTAELSFKEWIWLLCISSLPLWVHEFMVPLYHHKKRKKKK